MMAFLVILWAVVCSVLAVLALGLLGILLRVCADALGWQCGVLARWGSFWVGWHWSPYNRRVCINLVPCVTVWVTLKGGNTP